MPIYQAADNRLAYDSGGKVVEAIVQPVVGLAQTAFAASIANGASLSGAIDLGDRRAVRLVMPSALVGTTLTFQASADGASFTELYDEFGNAVSYTVAASRSVRLPIADWLGIRYLKIRTGTVAAPSVQSGPCTINVVAQ